MALRRQHGDEDLDSEFEFTSEKRRKTWRDDPLALQKPVTHAPQHSAAMPSKQLVSHERDREEWRARRYHLLSMDAYSRHKALVNQYLLTQGCGIEHFKRSTENDRNDYTILREQHKFLWEGSDDAGSWEQRLAKAYYDKLFKEYAISDLSHYKENKIALRWRTEKEVVDGKGQFICGDKRCSEREELQSWEVNFAYVEQGERKNALVKLRLCPECSVKLNYHHKKKLWKKEEKKRQRKKEQRHTSGHKRKHKHDHKHKHKKEKKERREWKEKLSRDSSEDSSSDEGRSKEEGSSTHKEEAGASAIWSKPAEALLDKTKEEEYDEYFKDMLL